MLPRIIDWSARHRWLVILAYLALALGAREAIHRVPLDAIPDNSSNAHRITRAEVEAALTDWCASHGDAPLCRKMQAQ
jgi:Cu/Ag efflux pump CusA